MKIVIKCEGLTVRTKDLGMGLSILNRIANSGIMKHTFVPNSLLSKAIKVIDNATSTGEMAKRLLQKAKDNFVMPEIAPAEKKQKTVKSGYTAKGWTIDEDKLVCDMINKPVAKVASNKTLLKRHSKAAIKTRLSVFKTGRLDRIGKDRANLMRAYLSGEKIETPVADINKHVPTPIVDKIEKKYSQNGNMLWSDADLELLKANINAPIKELMKLFPDRTRSALQGKRTKVKKDLGLKPKNTKGGSWTEEEREAVRLNMHMKPKELAKMPWLKNKTVNQISQQKYWLKKNAS